MSSLSVRRVAACVLFALLWAGCSGGDDSATLGRSGAASPAAEGDLAQTVAGLCLARRQAATDPPAAKVTYERRSRQGVETATSALRPSYSILAADLAEATSAVEADLATDPPPPSLAPNLSSLIERMREGAARLGTSTSACEKEGSR